MGVVDYVKGLFTGRARDEPLPTDVDGEGKPLFRDELVAFVKNEAEKRRADRTMLERQWTLNANFLMGNQWCAINTYRDDAKIVDIERLNYYEERETFNRIAPLYSTRAANLAKVTYDMRVKPATDELDDYYKAEVSTALLKSAKEKTDFDRLNKMAQSWAEITGNAFYYVFWDKNAGEEYARGESVTIDGEGEPKTETEIIRGGEVGLCLLTPYEVFPESLYKQGIEAQRSLIVEQVATVQEVQDVYGVELTGGSVLAFDISPSPVTGGLGYISTVTSVSTHTVENAVKVITYFEVPSSEHPDGRMIIVAGDELMFYGALPCGEIPIVQQTCISVAGQFFGKSWIEDVIPAQRAYNGCVNKLHDYIRSTAVNIYAVEDGSMEHLEELEEEGLPYGSILSYKQGRTAPHPLSTANLPSEVTNEIYRLQSEMEYTAGLSHLQLYGDAANSVTAASAIEQLREVDDTRLSQTAESIRASVKRVARLWLRLYKNHAKLYRVLRATGINLFGDAIVWSAEDISDADIVFTTENELLNSPEKQQEAFLNAWNMGLFADNETGAVPPEIKHKAVKMLKTNDWDDALTVYDLQTTRATRENNLFESGSVPEIGEYDDHEIHIEEHKKYVLQVRFELLKRRKPKYARLMLDHIKEHENILNEQKGLTNNGNGIDMGRHNEGNEGLLPDGMAQQH